MRVSMLARFAALLLVPTLLINSLAFACDKPTNVAAVKVKVAARGVGQGVRVTLSDQSSATGVVAGIGEQGFTLQSNGDSKPRDIQYAQITGVHKDKLSTGKKVAIVAIIGAAAVAIYVAVVMNHAANVYNSQPH